MKSEFIYKENNSRLIVIFAGWAMDSTPFHTLRRDGYDVMVVWDYRDFSLDWSYTADYAEICIVAWSLGVYAAAVASVPIAARTTLRIAVNGTLTPVDNQRGIPVAIFEGTLDGLNGRNLSKFYRRIAGSRDVFECFAASMPKRDIEELKEELAAFLPKDFFSQQPDTRFDRAIISRDDAIFPAVNQWRAWEGTPTSIVEGAHLPDFQAILERFIRDKDFTCRRFAAGSPSYDGNATVQLGLVEKMRTVMENFDIPALMCRRGSRTIEIGSGTGSLSEILDSYAGRFGTIEMWDIAGEAPLEGPRRIFRRTDAELQLLRTPSASADFIVSASTVQWFNSPSRFLQESARVLTHGGLLLIGTYSTGNLASVEAVTGRGLPLLSPEQWQQLAPDNLELLHSMDYTEEMEFDSAADIFRHLKATGVNSLSRNTGAGTLRRAIKAMQPGLDGKFRIEYRPILFLYRRK